MKRIFIVCAGFSFWHKDSGQLFNTHNVALHHSLNFYLLARFIVRSFAHIISSSCFSCFHSRVFSFIFCAWINAIVKIEEKQINLFKLSVYFIWSHYYATRSFYTFACVCVFVSSNIIDVITRLLLSSLVR